MLRKLTFSNFLLTFPSEDACLEEFKKLRFPNGIFCNNCQDFVKHYKLKGRNSYSCKDCRRQVYPLRGTIMEKTPSLRKWFFAMFIMTHSRAAISASQLQREVGVTYKAAWKMHKQITELMSLNGEDLTREPRDITRRWTLFSKLEITLTHKQEDEID